MTAYRKEATHEQSYATANGIAMLLLLIGMIAGLVAGILTLRQGFIWPAIGLGIASAFVSGGFFMLQPNEAGVLTLFGDYLGTDRTPGLRWTLPWPTVPQLIYQRSTSRRCRGSCCICLH